MHLPFHIEVAIYIDPQKGPAPVLMIDGVIIHNADIIGELDPDAVEKIDLIRERYFVGEYVFYGIINVITRRGDFDGFALPANAVRLPYRVTEPVVTFSSPSYGSPSARNNRIPDFRNTLYWNPELKPDDKGIYRADFFTSDVKSEYVINVQGIAADGSLISANKTIRVY